jgi:alpha-aminoadipic semialdehyde synthase
LDVLRTQLVKTKATSDSSANPTEINRFSNQNSSKISLTLGQVHENGMEREFDPKKKAGVLIHGAG